METDVKSPTFPGFLIRLNDSLIAVAVDVIIFYSNTILSLVIVREQLADKFELQVIELEVEMEKLSDGNDIYILLVEDKVCCTSMMKV